MIRFETISSVCGASRCLLFATLVLSLPASAAVFQTRMPRAEKHECQQEINQVDESWREALLKTNAKDLDGLLADDYMAVSATGTLQSKEQTLAGLRSGRIHFSAIALTGRKVRFYGTTAWVTSRATVSGASPEGNLSGRYRYTRVYARDGRGAWKIVSFEANRVR